MKVKNGYPDIFENLAYISLADLRLHNLFPKDGTTRKAILNIKRRHGLTEVAYSILVAVDTGCRYVDLDYQVNGHQVKHRIPLVGVPNPITNGHSLYFYCPYAKRKARKLYFNGRYFTARAAITNGYYLRDTLSKKARGGYEFTKTVTRLEKVIKNGRRTHFMTHYGGIPTGNHRKLTAARTQLSQMVK